MCKGSSLLRTFPSFVSREGVIIINPRLPARIIRRVMNTDFPALRDHVWLTTSGTRGRLKLVALGRAALETSARAVNALLEVTGHDRWINPLPLFHVGGLGIRLRASLAGVRCEELAGGWEPRRFVAAAQECRATLSSLVPTQVYDLVRGGWRAPARLRAVVVGGGALAHKLREEARTLGWPLLPSYGLTEAGSQVATAVSADADAEWLPLLPHMQARVDDGGVLELRGPSLLAGWMIFGEGSGGRFEDPKRDGWFRTSDRVELRGRELRVSGRVDDLVKIRGELVDVAAMERALQARVSSGEVMLRTVADERNGVAIHAVAENEEAAAEVREVAEEIFPPFAQPEIIRAGPIPRTALGKLVRL